ncbi:hypothetical protein ACTHQ6_14960 [Arthrobacter sp. SAFR-179]|uniref:hypothetical protein n=1 Tax=Arthrobacter sp. SAFR-179 TaxID=3387279 RepID=UPI003F7B5379
MESEADWDAANRQALEVIRWTLWGALARWATTENGPPSSYGRTVDAVARKGFYLGQLEDIARIQARIDVLKVRLSAGYPGT